MVSHRFLLTLGILLTPALVQTSLAGDKFRLLRSGMSQSEVAGLVGAPEQKESFELLRKDRWIYEDREIIFVGGRLTLPETDTSAPEPAAAMKEGVTEGVSKAPMVETAEQPGVVREIFKEVAKRSGGDEPGSGKKVIRPDVRRNLRNRRR